MTDLIEFLLSSPLPLALIVLGLLLAASLLFKRYFGLEPREEARKIASGIGLVLILVGAVLWVWTPIAEKMQSETGTETASSGWYTVPEVGHGCTTEICENQGGCAKCVTIRVDLPLGATVHDVRYFVRRQSDGTPSNVAVGQNLEWARFVGPRQYNTAINTVVEITLMNWRASYSRTGMIEVEWS